MKNIVLGLMLIALPALAKNHNQDRSPKAEAQRKSLTSIEKDIVSKVLSANDNLFNAFLNKDSNLISQKTNDIMVLVESSNSVILKDVKSKIIELKKIKATNTHADSLKAYEGFSDSLIQVVQKYDVGSHYNIFSCPMVKKSWIQDVRVNKNVRNVYAMEMLECGTQDTKF